MFPVSLLLENRLCVVIGGGPVGRRKAKKLLAAGARVHVVCLEESPPDELKCVHWITEPYQARHLEGAFLVCAAATLEVNRRVVADAKERGLLVNSATEPENGDFILPAVLNRGDLLVAISTSGRAPGLAREVRMLLEEFLDERFGQWLALVANLRPVILQKFENEEKRRAILARICRREWLERLPTDGIDVVRRAMWREIEEAVKEKEESV